MPVIRRGRFGSMGGNIGFSPALGNILFLSLLIILAVCFCLCWCCRTIHSIEHWCLKYKVKKRKPEPEFASLECHTEAYPNLYVIGSPQQIQPSKGNVCGDEDSGYYNQSTTSSNVYSSNKSEDHLYCTIDELGIS